VCAGARVAGRDSSDCGHPAARRRAGRACASLRPMGVTEITSGLRFPEGPVWMPDGSVLCVELLGGSVVRVQSDGKKAVVSENGGSPNGLAIGPDGAVYVCNSGGYGSHDLRGLTIPDSYLPQDHTGGRIERV